MTVELNLNVINSQTSSTTPTTSSHNVNYFAALADDDDDETDDNTLATIASTHEQCNTWAAITVHNNQTQPRHIINHASALSDSGATSHFIVEGGHITNKQIALNPITITLHEGATLQSMHTCNVDIPWLHHKATTAHIVPGLAHASLLSTAHFCNASYTVYFDATFCRIYDGPTLVLEGGCNIATNLWRLPLNPHSPPSMPQTPNNAINMAPNTPLAPQQLNNVHTTTLLQIEMN